MQHANYQHELALLEQVHVALGSAVKLEDFYIICAGMLVDPNCFGFSRAFLFRYDNLGQKFFGKLALDVGNPGEDRRFRDELLEEGRRLQDLVENIQQQSPEPLAVQSLYDLRYHSLWIRLLQGDQDGAGLNSGFQDFEVKRHGLPESHLLEQTAANPHARIHQQGETDTAGLEEFVALPLIAGRLITKRGLHGLLICDNSYSAAPLDDEALYRFQWFLNHCCIALDNVELVEDLTATSEKLAEVDRLKTNFLSIVSHELRTPLTSIIGFVHLIAEEKMGCLTPAQSDLLRRVAQHSEHLQSMVNDLLEIAEVEAGGMINVNITAVDPLACFLNILPKVETRRGTKQIAVEPLVRTRVPMIRGDAKALERIYYHLLDNAIKFTPKEGRVTVDFTPVGNMLEITIADTGIGMSPENTQRIFDHFYQVDSRLERVFGGMGIGLTVVKLLLEASGGVIRVESEPGKGSRFTLCYPLAAQEITVRIIKQ